jgi:hypothetical protein
MTPAPVAVVVAESEARSADTLRQLLRQQQWAAGGGCWVATLTQYECVQAWPAPLPARDGVATPPSPPPPVCYPVHRFWKQCEGKASVEITPLVHTPEDRLRHRRLHDTAPRNGR